METVVIEKRNSDVFSDDKQERLTYLSIGKRKAAADSAGQSLIEGFTPRQQAEFDSGITIEKYAENKGIVL